MNKPLLSFCVNDMIELQAEIAAAKNTGVTICLMITETAIRFAGYSYLLSFLKEAKQELKDHVLIELDHGKNFDLIKQAIHDSFDIVMIDGSELSFAENVKTSRTVAELAHNKGIQVEAAIGKIGNLSIDEGKTVGKLTTPEKAHDFMTETGVDYLAVSVGNYHGNSHNKPPLHLDLIAQISKQVSCPLVLHGADYISSKELKETIKHGVQKINFGPEIRHAYWNSLVRSTKEIHSDDPRDAFMHARAAIEKVVEKRLREILQ
jgi:ketose-bisphosphate aldolase